MPLGQWRRKGFILFARDDDVVPGSVAAIQETLLHQMLHVFVDGADGTGSDAVGDLLKGGTTPFVQEESPDELKDR
jgi:hypothetical protein